MTRVKLNVEVRSVFLPLFEDPARFNVVVAHRRCGKTVASIQKLVSEAMGATKPNARYGYVAPLRNQAKNIAWDYLKRMSQQIPTTKINEAELRIDYPTGARIQLFGSDNPDAVRGGYFDGVTLDEVAQMPPNTWTHVIRPMLADRHGWGTFIGTPAGKNAFFDLWEKALNGNAWARMMLKASETGILSQAELDDAKASMSPEAYQQEFECSFTAAVRGAFYGRVIEELEANGHLSYLDADGSRRIMTGWDIGTRDSTAIWVAQPYQGNSWALLDYYENTGEGVGHYVDWINSNGYDCNATHYAPHDVANRDWSAVDGKTRIEVAADLGMKLERAKRPQNGVALMDQINVVRNQLPRCYFHTGESDRGQRVARGRLALSLYRQAYNEKLGALAAAPLHDWTSHAADAFRTLLIGAQDARGSSRDDESWDRDRRINLPGHGRQHSSFGYSRRG